ncbi:NADPH:quinone oxidoreductase family protein [Epibacterium ulvae]|uniref:NADPH:quinone oxidoreductase family protein n=1 Tax=Epibacterium ulvae TaxID=1156985 RepID=UPI001BFC56C0|nr:NADPH:quinone oxidoreductase family protein [Epibacterium ulvae]MBT8155580.1 NADPH:quinone oxidoreductase family protein [Epibacterium ulvae]
MQAYQVSAPGTARLVSLPEHAPGPGQIGVRIAACGLNFADLLMIKGTYQDTPPLPFVPGLEVAGWVTSVGANVTELELGMRVAIFGGQGGLAQYGVFDAARAVQLPDAMGFSEAAGFQIAYGTSLLALDHCARLQPGETLLVTGAAGGVGLTAVEIGKKMGARVIAHARGAEKLAVAKAAGADVLVEASDDLRSVVKELGGADVVYETIGGDVWTAAFRATNPGGRLLPIGFAGGDVPHIPANHLLVKNLTVIGLYFGGLLKSHPEVVQNALAKLFGWFADGSIRPHVSHEIPLDQVADALELLRSRKSTGKVVITMAGDAAP